MNALSRVYLQYHVKTKTVHFCYLGKQNQVDMKWVFINSLCTKLYAVSVITPKKKLKSVSGEIQSFLSKDFLCSEINLPAELWRPYNLIARITLITKTQSWLPLPVFVIIKGREWFSLRITFLLWMRPYCDESCWSSDIGIFYWHLCRINSVCSLFSNILSWSDGREASIWCQPNWILSSTNDIFNVPRASHYHKDSHFSISLSKNKSYGPQ